MLKTWIKQLQKCIIKRNTNNGTTASNSQESSYACYHDIVRGTYLGDVYSVVWMEDSDVEQLDKETLFQQYSLTQQRTNTSHVMQYGDLV